ncbi:ribonuclease G [Anaerobium acetethylicum]|uniref:Ribonuclease G n=2 Tax=Anaerobium acetethylicum TaxID=1619234 RepID=A0A1D3TNT2_9FIRM|nr:ribonuclease E/G [Anaerobium acetethylicum]SCP94984.1 ribonuclease G [Anaerobium acetethylicum]
MKILHSKLVITRMSDKYASDSQEEKNPDNIITALYEDGDLVELNCEKAESDRILNNIYIGKVKNIVSNIQAAFIEIADGLMCYYSFEDNKSPIFVNHKNSQKLAIGDELLVQVSKENVKTKAPVVTSNLSFAGKYMVLTTGNCRIGISGKIPEEQKKRLKSWVKPYASEDYGFIVRTNAKDAQKEQIEKEIEALIRRYNDVKSAGLHRTCFSLIYQAPPAYLTNLRDTYARNLESIITDDGELYGAMKAYLELEQKEDAGKLMFYEDSLLPLQKLYSLETRLKEALREQVWLKSGAYLIIQPTEAFVVIDVNTGKFTGKKKLQDTFLKINLEAAKEIAKQLRLRNLSGIIVVDFIDMEREEDRQSLMESLDECLKKDPVKATLVGMSRLNLVEITRKKVRKPLKEQMVVQCPVCGGRGYLY